MELIGLLIFLGVICILSGPVALIISIIALNKVKDKFPIHHEQAAYQKPNEEISPPMSELHPVEPPVVPTSTVPAILTEEKQTEQPKSEFDILIKHEKRETSKELNIWEQWIGTRGLLIAGIIVIFFAVGFFLKYAYDNFSMGPQGRVIGVTIFGLVTLVVGEITRRRGFGIVAKGVTALGFATLYAAVFTAYQIYNLIGYLPACTAASIITIIAMIYAVALDEVLIAFLSLLGGFATPVMVLLKVINPAPLFVYILILGAGAMACSYYRKWKTVNLLSFIGTFTLFSIWYYNSSYYNYKGAFSLREIIFVLSWLAVFFLFYLVMPVFYGLVNRVKSYKQDVLLILADSAATLYYLFTVLAETPRNYLALSVVILACLFLSFSAIVYKRCRDDVNLRICLHAIGIFCATLAVPLYFKLDATTVTWALEAVVLVYIGMRYSSILTQLAGLIVVGLSIGCLLANLPMHSGDFKLILNIEFAEWLLVSASVFIIHLLYRTNKQLPEIATKTLPQILYGLSMAVLFTACWIEWSLYQTNYIKQESGRLLIFAIMLIMFLPRFIKPEGIISEVLSWVLIIASAVFCWDAVRYTAFSDSAFWTIDFAITLALLTVMLIYQIRYRKISNVGSQILYIVFGALLLIAVYFRWASYCGSCLPDDKLIRGTIFIYAIGVLLFVIRPITPKGIIPKIVAAIVAVAGAVYMIGVFQQLNLAPFKIFLNINFLIAVVFIISLFLAAKFTSTDKIFKPAFAIVGIITLWVILSQEIYLYWQHKTFDDEHIANWQFLAQMYISIAWAIYAFILMVLGFVRNNAYLRYISFLIFGVLLAKVFLVDTHEIKNIYRVAAFLVTGATFVGVSYLYQFLKKNGFFDTLFISDSEKRD
jgi:uncharacterized membrane protein